MRVQTDLIQEDYKQLKKESKEVLGLDGFLYPPFGATQDYVEFHIFDMSGNFKERSKSENYTLEDGKIVLNIGQDFRDLGYNRGNYRVRYFFIRPNAGSGDEIVLTKTVDGNVGQIHSGNPELTGVPMGEFHVDDEGNAFVGLEPPLEGESLSLDIKEWKYQINAISSDRKEISLIPQIIDNVKYKDNFRNLVDDKTLYYSTKQDIPQDEIAEAYQNAIQNFQNPQEAIAQIIADNSGGEVSFTGPDSTRIEFNSRVESDDGFDEKMRQGKVVVKNAYITEYLTQPDIKENSSYNIEDPIPELYIEIVKSPDTRVVDFQLKTKEGGTFNPNINGVQFYWEFGCGHKEEATTNSNASHEYDVDGNYTPSVYVFTPNFSDEISELRTPTGRVVDILDTSLAVNQTSDDTSTEEIDSVFNGKIIRWDGSTLSPQGIPQSIPGQQSTTESRWYVQDGYRRWIGSSYNLNLLRNLKGLLAEDDVSLYSILINQIPVGPIIGGGTFTNTTPPSLDETLTADSPGIVGTLGFYGQDDEGGNQGESDDDVDDDPPQDDNDDDSGPFTVTIVNSPIIANETAGSMVAFYGDNYTSTTDSDQIQKPFDAAQIVSFKGKAMGATGINPFMGFFDDPDFTQPSFTPQPDAEDLVDIFLNSSRTFFVKVETGF